ncbi:MAG: G1 family glutamic endopeptidase [Solirubrobacteraceae bacterium]
MIVSALDTSRRERGVARRGWFARAGRYGRGGVLQRAAVAVALTLAAAAVVCAAADASTRRGSFGTFAGYLVDEHVTSISASWRVPEVRSRSRPGRAATWVGVQQGFSGSTPFIQVGTLENRYADRRGVGFDVYYAFWSDTKMHFKPAPIENLNAGDYVSARLALSRKGWRVSVTDETEHWSRSFWTKDETINAWFVTAEWFQEDPTMQRSTKPFAYPQLSRVSLQRVAVNDAAPRIAGLQTQWLSLPGSNIVPSAFADDQFTIGTETAPQAQYLADVAEPDAAIRAFVAESGRWDRHTSAALAAAQAARCARVLNVQVSKIAAQRWPVSVDRLIRVFVSRQRAVVADLGARTFARGSSVTWLVRFNADAANGSSVAHHIRRELGIPSSGV